MENRIREAIWAYCEQELGTTEIPAGSNIVKYNDHYYEEGHRYFSVPKDYPWCGTFCWEAYLQGGFEIPKEYKIHYVPTTYYKAKIKKFTTKEPKLGDLIIFEFASDSDNEIDHIGIFGEWIVKDVSFTTIEGNTSSSDKGSQSNGGGVFKKKREMKDVLAFVNLIDNIK
jgi:hypothetical protein